MYITRLQHENPVKWATKVLPSVVLRSCLHGTPVASVGTSSWVAHGFWLAMLCPWCQVWRYREATQNYFVVAQILILLCIIILLSNVLYMSIMFSVYTNTNVQLAIWIFTYLFFSSSRNSLMNSYTTRKSCISCHLGLRWTPCGTPQDLSTSECK